MSQMHYDCKSGTVSGVLSFKVKGEDGIVLEVEIKGALAPTPDDIRKVAALLEKNAPMMGLPRANRTTVPAPGPEQRSGILKEVWDHVHALPSSVPGEELMRGKVLSALMQLENK